MRRAALWATLLVLAAGCDAATIQRPDQPTLSSPSLAPSPSSSPEPRYRPAGRFSAGRAHRHVRVLAGHIGNRPAGSEAYRRAAVYVRDFFERLGYGVRLARFSLPDGSPSWNVVASWPERARPRAIVGGHLDTVPVAPGGNDNASGVAVTLELARIFAGTREALSIRFVAFGGEERQPGGSHHLGSVALSGAMSDRVRSGVRGMVSIDAVGRDAPLVTGWLGLAERDAVDGLIKAAEKEGAPISERITGNISDNGSFELAGVSSAFLWTGLDPHNHAPGDTVDNVSRAALGRAGNVVRAYLLRLL